MTHVTTPDVEVGATAIAPTAVAAAPSSSPQQLATTLTVEIGDRHTREQPSPNEDHPLAVSSLDLLVQQVSKSLDHAKSIPAAQTQQGNQQEHGYQPPPPGDGMNFDRGHLFAKPPTRPDPQRSTTELSNILLPVPPSLPRNNSYPEPGGNNYRLHPHNLHPLAGQGRPHSNHPAESRSAPIHLHHPHPHQHHPHPPSARRSPNSGPIPTRTPSPSSFTTLQGSPSQQNLSTYGSNNSLYHQYNGRPYTLYSAPAALRPDSICSFPDSSPLMAPHVLAAVDARLRASASSSTLNVNSPPRSHQGTFAANVLSGSKSARSGTESRASSFAPVITHDQMLQSSGTAMSREQLYDLLNRDDDDGEDQGSRAGHKQCSGDDDTDTETQNDASALHLGKPKPEFVGRSSNRSSRRSSVTSSTFGDSEIELNTKRSSSGFKATGSGLATVATIREKGSSSVYDEYAVATGKIEKSPWLKSKSRTTRKWRGICCAVGLLALVAAIAGITLGFVLRKGTVDGLAKPQPQPQPQPQGPDRPTTKPPVGPITQFTPNPNLRKAFYGVDYNPAKSLMPWCGATLQSVVNDVILMSQITNRIRLYGMDCNQADLTFQAIKALNLSMEVVLTIWVDKDPVTYQRQYDTLFKVLDTYGTDMLTGVSVGNEVLFRGDQNLTTLGDMMQTVRTNLKTRYNKSIPVFTSDVGVNMDSKLASLSDMLQANLHPYFSGTPAENAANWTFSQYASNITAFPVSSGLKGVISEVGWPSAPASAVYLGGSVPGLANMQTVVDTFVCQANAAGVPYYWFEFQDATWKQDPGVPVEPYWGIFDKDANVKIKIPNCIAP